MHRQRNCHRRQTGYSAQRRGGCQLCWWRTCRLSSNCSHSPVKEEGRRSAVSEGDESRAGPLRLEKVWTSQPREWRKESKRGMESCRLEAEGPPVPVHHESERRQHGHLFLSVSDTRRQEWSRQIPRLN